MLLTCYRDSAKLSPCAISMLPICCRWSTNALSRCNVWSINWLSTCYQWTARYLIMRYNLRMLQICYRFAANPLFMRSEWCCNLCAIAILSTRGGCANNMLRSLSRHMLSICDRHAIIVRLSIYDRAIIDVLSECYRYGINPTPLNRLDSISIIIINNLRSILSD